LKAKPPASEERQGNCTVKLSLHEKYEQLLTLSIGQCCSYAPAIYCSNLWGISNHVTARVGIV
jgi:hypothetical protein